MNEERTDVLVIGAGPVGLTLAAELRRHEINVRLVERRKEPHPHPNAAIVHVRTLEILSAMGAIDLFLPKSYPLSGIYSQTKGKPLGFIEVEGVKSPFSGPRTIPQHTTEALLTEHLHRLGGRIERDTEAIGLEQDGDSVRVRLRHSGENGRESVATTRWVVGCEGSASMCREALKIPFEGERYTGKEFLQADAHVLWSFPHGFGYQFIAQDRILMFFPYDATGHYRIICARNDQDAGNHEPPTLAEMETIIRELADPTASLHDSTWLNRFRTGYRLARTFRQERVFLAGDAGHVHIPIGGQGMNYGMHDAFNLAWKLAAVAKGEAQSVLLDSYEAERRPADEGLIHGTDRGFHALVESHPAIQSAMQLLGPSLLALPVVQKRVRDVLAEVRVAYPDSPLSENHLFGTGPAAGSRAPDARIVRMPQRESGSLHELFRDTRWTLLLFAGHNPSPREVEALEKIGGGMARRYGRRVAAFLVFCGDPPVPVHENWSAGILMDRMHLAHRAYGVTRSPRLYLIRPDGYVGFRGAHRPHHRNLAAYLDRVLT